MRPENDPLQALDPFLGALGTVGAKVVRAVMSGDGEVDGVLVLVCDGCGDTISEIDLATRKIEVLRITIVGEDVTLEAEPVAIVLGISLAAL